MLAYPAVAEAAVVGAADRQWGEEVVAFLVLRTGKEILIEELQTFCHQRLARFKVPRRIRVVPALPLTSVGKVDNARLRSLATPDETT